MARRCASRMSGGRGGGAGSLHERDQQIVYRIGRLEEHAPGADHDELQGARRPAGGRRRRSREFGDRLVGDVVTGFRWCGRRLVEGLIGGLRRLGSWFVGEFVGGFVGGFLRGGRQLLGSGFGEEFVGGFLRRRGRHLDPLAGMIGCSGLFRRTGGGRFRFGSLGRLRKSCLGGFPCRRLRHRLVPGGRLRARQLRLRPGVRLGELRLRHLSLGRLGRLGGLGLGRLSLGHLSRLGLRPGVRLGGLGLGRLSHLSLGSASANSGWAASGSASSAPVGSGCAASAGSGCGLASASAGSGCALAASAASASAGSGWAASASAASAPAGSGCAQASAPVRLRLRRLGFVEGVSPARPSSWREPPRRSGPDSTGRRTRRRSGRPGRRPRGRRPGPPRRRQVG